MSHPNVTSRSVNHEGQPNSLILLPLSLVSPGFRSSQSNGLPAGFLENTTSNKMSQDQLRVLIVGNGGREHAFAWKLSQSPRVEIVYVAPGNGGTGLGASGKITNANIKGDDYPGLVAFAQKNGVNLVVPGPEAPLVDGIQGYFQAGKWTPSVP